MDSTPEKLRFASIPGRSIRADFAGGGLSSDLGPLLLKGVDRQIGLTERVCAAINDTRHPGYITHSLHDILKQRIYQIASGYEDGNDCNSLRHDPVFRLGVGYTTRLPRRGGPFNPAALDGLRTEGIEPTKTNWALKFDKPPYLCWIVTGGITFTFGGIKINKEEQVMSTGWRPIEGLYAAGEMVGGLFHHNYALGSGLMSGAVFGRIAGRSAAKA